MNEWLCCSIDSAFQIFWLLANRLPKLHQYIPLHVTFCLCMSVVFENHLTSQSCAPNKLNTTFLFGSFSPRLPPFAYTILNSVLFLPVSVYCSIDFTFQKSHHCGRVFKLNKHLFSESFPCRLVAKPFPGLSPRQGR